MSKQIPDEELLTDLHRVADDLGKTPTTREYTEHGSYSRDTISRRFGSWNDALAEIGYSPNESKGTPEKDLLADIRRVADILGKTPTTREYTNQGSYSIGKVFRRFGSWNDALAEIGFDPNQVISDKKLLADIQQVADNIGKTPSRKEYVEYGAHAAQTVVRHFGSWNNAVTEAGLDPNPTEVTVETLLTDIHRVADKLGETPSCSQYLEHGDHSPTTVRNKFGGSWKAGVREAGFEPKGAKIPEQKLFADIQEVAERVGQTPTTRQYREYGTHSRDTMMNRFGSWHNAVRAAGLELVNHKKADPKRILKDIVRVADGDIAPTPSEFDIGGEYHSATVIETFGSWWKAVVRAGLKPYKRRPLSPAVFDRYFQEVRDRPPEQSLPMLLFMFTGIDQPIARELRYEWLRHNRNRNIVRVPAEYTQHGSPWLFRMPDMWYNPHTQERIQTGLPQAVDWVLNNYRDGEIPIGSQTPLTRRCYRVGREAGIKNRELREYAELGEVPLIRPADLSYTHGVNLVRQGVDSDIIERRLGVDGYRGRFNVEDVMLWAFVREDIVHSEFEPPEVFLNPD